MNLTMASKAAVVDGEAKLLPVEPAEDNDRNRFFSCRHKHRKNLLFKKRSMKKPRSTYLTIEQQQAVSKNSLTFGKIPSESIKATSL